MSTEIAQQLKQARMAAGLTLDELQDLTRISRGELAALENGKFEQLPGPFYVRAYLRAYATKVGLEPTPLLNQYRPTDPQPSAGAKTSTSHWESGNQPRTTGPQPRAAGDHPRITGGQPRFSGKQSGGDSQPTQRFTGNQASLTGRHPRVTDDRSRWDRGNRRSTGSQPRITESQRRVTGSQPPVSKPLSGVNDHHPYRTTPTVTSTEHKKPDSVSTSPASDSHTPSTTVEEKPSRSIPGRRKIRHIASSFRWPAWVAAIGALLLIPLGLWMGGMLSGIGSTSAGSPSENQAVTDDADAYTPEGMALVSRDDQKSVYEMANNQDLLLEVKADDTCWVQVKENEEGGYLKDITLEKGDPPFRFTHPKNVTTDLWIYLGSPKDAKVQINGQKINASKVIHIKKVR